MITKSCWCNDYTKEKVLQRVGFFPCLTSVRLKIHTKYNLLAESHTNFSHCSKQLIASDIKFSSWNASLCSWYFCHSLDLSFLMIFAFRLEGPKLSKAESFLQIILSYKKPVRNLIQVVQYQCTY